MSKFVIQIIKDMERNASSFLDNKGEGVKKGRIVVSRYNLGFKFTSLIMVEINGEEIPTTFSDRWKLETAVENWYKNINIDVLISSNNKEGYL